MKHHEGVEIVVDPVLRERVSVNRWLCSNAAVHRCGQALGYLEGKTLCNLHKTRISASGTDTIEPIASFSKRLATWWNRKIMQSVLSRSKDNDDEVANVLVVTHGGAIHTLVEDLLGSRKIKAAKGVAHDKCMNGSITIIEVERSSRRGHLLAFGDVQHLGKALWARADRACT